MVGVAAMAKSGVAGSMSMACDRPCQVMFGWNSVNAATDTAERARPSSGPGTVDFELPGCQPTTIEPTTNNTPDALKHR